MTTHIERPRAKFTQMIDGTAEEWAIIEHEMIELAKGLPARLLTHLKILRDDFGGFAVDRLEHSLQTATRAADDGRDEEYVACALLHDIGDTLGPMNHDQIAAAIIQPFVSEKNHWIIGHHAIFQGYYFFEYAGLDKNMRDGTRIMNTTVTAKNFVASTTRTHLIRNSHPCRSSNSNR